jgi:PiT family inorganic phosphate transporter
MSLALAIGCALAFSFTNGFHDAANAIATLVATRAAQPSWALALAAVFNVLGALVVGTAVAGTIAGIVTVAPASAVAVIGSGVLAAVIWNVLTWWRGLPSSSGHALVGGLVGAAIADAGVHAVNWGGLNGLRPDGVIGVLIALAISPVIGFGIGLGAVAAQRRGLRRAARGIAGPLRSGQWLASAGLAFSHGANDGQKAMGVIAALLVASGHLEAFAVPLWVKLVCAVTLTAGTATGGWRIVRTIGRRIFRLSSADAFASQSASTAVILAASFLGGPVSTTQVVASSIVGVGGGHRRWRHVRWSVVRAMGFAWVATLPATAALGAFTLVLWTAIP